MEVVASGVATDVFYPDSWLPGFLPALQPASPHWRCELSGSLPLLRQAPLVGVRHFQQGVLTP